MATDIWADRCRDCFDQFKALVPFDNTRLADPFVAGLFLCAECHRAREEDARFGKPIRPIGIPADVANATWVDLEDVVVSLESGKRELRVKVKFRMPNIPKPSIDDGGEVRIRIGDNLY